MHFFVMDFSKDISDAVEAHFSVGGGDLRSEIEASIRSSSKRTQNIERSPTFRHHDSGLFPYPNERNISHHSGMHMNPTLRREDHEMYPERQFSSGVFQPAPSSELGQISDYKRFDEPSYNRPLPPPPPDPYLRVRLPMRRVEEYKERLDFSDHARDYPVPNPRLPSPAREARFHDFKPRPQRPEIPFSRRRDGELIHALLPRRSGFSTYGKDVGSETRSKPLLQIAPVNSKKHGSSSEYRYKLPPRRRSSPTRTRMQSKRHFKRVPSRVYEEEESAEESFDDLLQQYKQNQTGAQIGQLVKSSEILEQYKQMLDTHTPSREMFRQDAGLQSYQDTYPITNQFSLSEEGIFHENVPPVQEEIEQMGMTAGGKNDKFENVAPLKSAINALAAESQGSERKDDDSLVEEDINEDEELLQLRLAALTSAYSRNIDIQKSSSALDEHDENDVEDGKAKKKKTKKAKERRKSNRKDIISRRSPRSSKKTGDYSSTDDELTYSSSKHKSPEKIYLDPKMLTLKSEMLKNMQEKVELGSIKTSEGELLSFMDIIKAKSESEHRNNNTARKVNESVDNYDEVEMEVEEEEVNDGIVFPQVQSQHAADGTCDFISEVASETNIHDKKDAENFSYRQESSFCDQPAVEEPVSLILPSISRGPTTADQLISSIRANLNKGPAVENPLPPDEKLATAMTPPGTTFSLSANAMPSGVDVSAIPKEVEIDQISNVDSPSEFVHAFQRSDSLDTYPAIATDLSFPEKDRLTSTVLDAAETESNFAPSSQDESDADLQKEKNPEESISDQKSLKGCSLDDEEELRAKLLLDLAIRRGKDSAKTSKERADAEDQTQIEVANDSLSSSLDQHDSLNLVGKSTSPLNTSFTLIRKRYLAHRKASIQRLKKKEWLRERSLVARKRKTKITHNKTKKSQQQASAQDLVKKFSDETSENSVVRTKITTEGSMANKPSMDKNIVFNFTDGSPAVRASPTSAISTRPTIAPVTLTTALSGGNKLYHVAKGSAAPSNPTKPFPSKPIVMQRMVHPPLVINLELSSDEGESFSQSSSHAVQDFSPKVIKEVCRRTISAKGLVKSSSSPSLLQRPTDVAKKRKAHNEQPTPSKLLRNADTETQNQVGIFLAKKQDEVQAIKSQLSKGETSLKVEEEKLHKVRRLLEADRVLLSRLHEKQTDKEKQLESLQLKMAALKNELEKIESDITTAVDFVDKIKKDKSVMINTMQKRSILETRLQSRILELRTSIINDTNRLGALTSEENVPQTNDQDQVVQRTGDSTDSHSGGNAPMELTKSAMSQPAQSFEAMQQIEKNKKKEERIKKGKQLLLEKERKLRIQKEKYLLKQAEMKLNMIKKKAKQSLRAKKQRRSSSDRSSNQSLAGKRKPLIGQCHSKLLKTAMQMVRTSTPVTKPSKGANTAESQTKIEPKKKVLINLREDLSVGSSENLKPSAVNEQVDSNETVFDAKKDDKDDSVPLAPVTPTLKRTRSDRRSSSSSITTPTSTDLKPNNSPGCATESQILRLSSDETFKLKRRLSDVLLPIHHKEEQSSNYAFLTNIFPTPGCFADWYIDSSELVKQGGKDTATEDHISTRSSHYASPLRRFRSYRLSSNFFKESANSLTSLTYSHKINCNKILCRYDLTGKCRDSKCLKQHVKDLTLSPSEIYLDLLWYCPALLKTNEGRQITIGDPIDLQLKAADDTVGRLCRGGERSVEDTCKLLVQFINRALGNKRSISYLIGRARCKLYPMFDDDELEDASVASAESQTQNYPADDTITTDVERRYYNADKNRTDIDRLNGLLEKQPTNEKTRIELARAYIDLSKTEEKQNKKTRVELALHTLCVGIELNDESEALWTTYIPILRDHYKDTSMSLDQVEILDQALMLMPLSKPVWDQILKWDWPFEKLNFLFVQLIDNLFNRDQIWESKETKSPSEHELSYYSRWLLQAIAERCHLLLQAVDLHQAKAVLLESLEKLGAVKTDSPSGQSWRSILLQEDVVRLWLVYIYLLEYEQLPPYLYHQDKSSHMFGMTWRFGNVVIPFASSSRTVAPQQMRSLFKDALLHSTDLNESRITNAKRRFPIYQSMVNFEASLQNWDKVSKFCEGLVQLLGDERYAHAQAPSHVDVWVMWTEAVMRSNDVVLITETFDQAITACPQSARLAYMAALYQLTLESSDEEAALQYLESCVGTMIDLQGEEGLSASDLLQLYRRVLRHDVSIKPSDRLVLKDDASESLIEKEKIYLWLIFCALTEVIEEQKADAAGSDYLLVADHYEAALHILSSAEERKTVWIQYLLYLRSNAVLCDEAAVSKASKLNKRRKQLLWFKRFTSVVRHCLETMPCKYNIALAEDCEETETYIDYSFHNEVSTIYLECFPRSQMHVAFSILTDIMPTNIPLLSRAASFFLENEDPVSAASLLWRITSSYSMNGGESCKNVSLWKMAVRAFLDDGRFRKALRLLQRSLNVLSRSKELYHDAAVLALAYGSAEDYQALSHRCKAMLCVDVGSIIKNSLSVI